MLKAQQNVVLQSTNQGLVQIRGVEIAYYSSFYGSYGVSAAIIGGFAYSALTQIDIPINVPSPVASYNQTGIDIAGAIFWISGAASMCAGNVIISSYHFISRSINMLKRLVLIKLCLVVCSNARSFDHCFHKCIGPWSCFAWKRR